MKSTLALFRSEPCSKCGIRNRRQTHSWCVECHSENMRNWRKIHKLNDKQRIKDIARSYAGVYLRNGKIKKQPCTECGSLSSEMHHPDYSKPIDVVWLCRGCHLYEHKMMKERMTN